MLPTDRLRFFTGVGAIVVTIAAGQFSTNARFDDVNSRLGEIRTDPRGIKCFHRPDPDRIELQPRSSNPEQQVIVVDAQTADWEIAGVVVGAMIGARLTAGC